MYSDDAEFRRTSHYTERTEKTVAQNDRYFNYTTNGKYHIVTSFGVYDMRRMWSMVGQQRLYYGIDGNFSGSRTSPSATIGVLNYLNPRL